MRDIVVKVFEDNDVHCEEVIYQSDRVITNAYELLGKLFEVYEKHK